MIDPWQVSILGIGAGTCTSARGENQDVMLPRKGQPS
jgi:hypothetical protein